MMSRPLRSAPRKNLPSALNHCGPIGTPSSPTTFFDLPSTVIVSDRWFSLTVVFATLSAQSGAPMQESTRTTNSAPNSSATLLRFRRRSPSRQGPSPWTCSLSASLSQAAGPWRVVSVAGSVATRVHPQLSLADTLPDGEGALSTLPEVG